MNKYLVHISAFIGSNILAIMSSVTPALAEESTNTDGPIVLTPIQSGLDLVELIKGSYGTMLTFMGTLAGAMAVAYLIYGGILYIQGNAEAGKKIIINTVLGIGIVLLAVILVTTVINLMTPSGTGGG